MQATRNVAAAAKETAANSMASVRAGLDKTKATVQEKVEKMSSHDETQKDMATHKKDERIHNAESNKQEAHENNAAARHVASTGDGNQKFTTGTHTGPGFTGTYGNQNIAATGTGPTGVRIDGTGPFNTPDYLTGSNISTAGHNPGPNTHVEYPQTGPGTRAGLNPACEPGPLDAVYPQDIGVGDAAWQDPALNARGGLIN